MDEKLKERIVGAVVLVAAAVIVIPMVLSGPDDDGAPAPVPVAPEQASRVVPLKTDPSLTASAPASGAPPATDAADGSRTSAPPPLPSPAAPPVPPRPVAAAAPAPKAEAKLALSADSALTARPGPGWVVQLGSFTDRRNAEGLRERLVKKGYPAFVDTSTAGGNPVTRVYVGPEQTRDAARARLPALLEETRLKGIVTRFDG